MKLKVLIVDDSLLARANLINLIDWSSLGFEIVGEASNGQDALVFISNSPVDLVITDVYMPNMSGTELVKSIHEAYPDIAILVISSFNDFQDVKETLKHGAIDYIMKHNITPENFIPLISKIRDEIKRESISYDKEKNTLINSFGRKEFIRNLLLSGNPAFATEQGVYQNLKYDAIMLLEIDHFANLLNLYNDEYIHSIVSRIIDISIDCFSDMPNKQNDIIYLENGRFVILVKNSSTNLISILKTYHSRINERINEILHISSLCGICIITDDDRSLKTYYTDCKKQIEEQKKQLKNQNNHNKETFFLSLENEKNLISGFYTLDKDSINKLYDELFLSSDISINSAKMLAGEILSIMVKVSDHFSVKLDTILEENNVSLSDLKSMHFSTEIYNLLIALTNSLLKFGNLTKPKQYSDKIKPAISYIQKNYAEEISPADVASNVSFSHNWLNELFKLETGMSISSYITEVRIGAAKKLIEDGETNLQLVAHKSGFAYYSYFSRIFKNVVGVTPIKYLKQKNKP